MQIDLKVINFNSSQYYAKHTISFEFVCMNMPLPDNQSLTITLGMYLCCRNVIKTKFTERKTNLAFCINRLTPTACNLNEFK
jgi:hypothetical protein